MNYLKLISILLLAITLGACGGGGGNPGTNVNPVLSTTAPEILKIAPGTTQNFSIMGGTTPYTAVSDNIAVATAVASGSTLTVSGTSVGDALIKILDAAGTKINVAVTVGP